MISVYFLQFLKCYYYLLHYSSAWLCCILFLPIILSSFLSSWLSLIGPPGGVNRRLCALSGGIYLFYEWLSPTFLHLSHDVSCMSLFFICLNASIHKSPTQHWDSIIIWIKIKYCIIHFSHDWNSFEWLLLNAPTGGHCCLLMKISTHYFLRHSVARSILNSGRLTKPSAFSSCDG